MGQRPPPPAPAHAATCVQCNPTAIITRTRHRPCPPQPIHPSPPQRTAAHRGRQAGRGFKCFKCFRPFRGVWGCSAPTLPLCLALLDHLDALRQTGRGFGFWGFRGLRCSAHCSPPHLPVHLCALLVVPHHGLLVGRQRRVRDLRRRQCAQEGDVSTEQRVGGRAGGMVWAATLTGTGSRTTATTATTCMRQARPHAHMRTHGQPWCPAPQRPPAPQPRMHARMPATGAHACMRQARTTYVRAHRPRPALVPSSMRPQ